MGFMLSFMRAFSIRLRMWSAIGAGPKADHEIRIEPDQERNQRHNAEDRQAGPEGGENDVQDDFQKARNRARSHGAQCRRLPYVRLDPPRRRDWPTTGADRTNPIVIRVAS